MQNIWLALQQDLYVVGDSTNLLNILGDLVQKVLTPLVSLLNSMLSLPLARYRYKVVSVLLKKQCQVQSQIGSILTYGRHISFFIAWFGFGTLDIDLFFPVTPGTNQFTVRD